MTQNPETSLQQKAINYAKSMGVPCIRFTFQKGARRGWPDCLFLPPGGIPLFVEFKQEGNKPTELQRHHIDLLKKLSYQVHVIDKYEDFEYVLNQHMAAVQHAHKFFDETEFSDQ